MSEGARKGGTVRVRRGGTKRKVTADIDSTKERREESRVGERRLEMNG